jgi:hypothetical protein
MLAVAWNSICKWLIGNDKTMPCYFVAKATNL